MAGNSNPLLASANKQDPDQVRLIRAIDSLQKAGVGQILHLPRIVIIGDQSSGKSSLLDGIIGARVPAHDGLCTKFPTKITLRKDPIQNITATIEPALTRPHAQIADLEKFDRKVKSLNELETIMKDAGEAMGVGKGQKRFFEDTLHIEFAGPDCLDLSLTDLPGLFLTGGSQQTVKDAEMVENMAKHHLNQPRTTALVVVTAKTNHVSQLALGLVNKVDPRGEHTMGIITKPDTIRSATNRNAYLEFRSLLNNEIVILKHDWHIVKNRSEDETSLSNAKRNEVETAFFSGADWADVPSAKKGIESLCSKLRQLHFDTIKDNLPGLIAEAKNEAEKLKEQMENLPNQPNTADQRGQLALIGKKFTKVLNSSFANRKTEKDNGKGLALRGYVDGIISRLLNGLEKESDKVLHDKDWFEEQKTEVLKEIGNRQEIPGQLDKGLMSTLFYQYTEAWPIMINHEFDMIVHVSERCLAAALRECTDNEELAKGIEEELFKKVVANLKDDLHSTVNQIVGKHEEEPLIYFGQAVFEQVSKARAEYIFDVLKTRKTGATPGTLNYESALKEGCSELEGDIDTFAAVETIACVRAHYQVQHEDLRHKLRLDSIMRVLKERLENVMSMETFISTSSTASTAISDVEVLRIFGGNEGNEAAKESIKHKLKLVENATNVLRSYEPSSPSKRTHEEHDDCIEVPAKRGRKTKPK